MKLLVNSTQCLVPGLCPELVTRLKRGLVLTGVSASVALVSIGLAVITISS